MRFYDIVLCIDTSYSVRGRDFPPNRLSVLKDIALKIVDYVLSKEPFVRIGIIGFYMYAYPIIDLTRNRSELVEAINSVRVMGEATAPGEAVKEALDMLVLSRSPEGSRITILTDGTFNYGIELPVIAYYARRRSYRIDIVLLGRPSKTDIKLITPTVKMTKGVYVNIHSPRYLEKYLNEIPTRILID